MYYIMLIFLRGYAFDPRQRHFSLFSFRVSVQSIHVLACARTCMEVGRETVGPTAVGRLAQAILVVAQPTRTPAHLCLHGSGAAGVFLNRISFAAVLTSVSFNLLLSHG